MPPLLASVQGGSPGSVFLLLTGGAAALLFVLAFLAFRTGQQLPDQARLFRWLSAVALILAGLLLALTLFEMVFRVLYPDGFFSARPMRAVDEQAEVEALPDGQAYWEYLGVRDFDDRGYRGGRPADAAPGLRLGILGDSVTFGVQVPLAASFPVLLAQHLEKRCKGVQLINVATPGYSLRQSLIALERKVLPAHPDLVFLGLYSNDIAQFTVVGGTAYDLRMKEHDGIPIIKVLPLPDALTAFLLTRSVFYQFVTLRVLAAMDEASGRVQDQMVSALADLEAIRARCAEAGVPLIVALMPDLNRPLSEPENAGTARFYDPVREWAVKQSVPVLSLREPLAAYPLEEIRLDECCHYTEAGHQAVAEVLLRLLTDRGLLPCPAGR